MGAWGWVWVEEARELAVVPVVREGESCLRAMWWGSVEAWWVDCIEGVSWGGRRMGALVDAASVKAVEWFRNDGCTI